MNRHAVDAAGQVGALPCLGAVRQAEAMKPLVDPDHFRNNPGSLLPVGAPVDDLVEVLIERAPEFAGAKGASPAPPDVKPIHFNDGPWIGRPPKDGPSLLEPGKDTGTIRLHEPPGLQIAPHGHQA